MRHLGLSYVIILSILFFLTGMRLLSSNDRYDRHLQQIAHDRAKSLITLMSNNKTHAIAGSYASKHLSQIPVCRPCTKGEQSKLDLLHWQLANALSLPNGDGKVHFRGDRYRIHIRWNRDGEAVNDCQQPAKNCLIIEHML